ncbi:uncharacterized protein LOC144251035 [Urocitellus parryii]
MVTSWQGLSDMLPTTRGAGMVVDWEQETGLLMSSGDVRIVRIWDTNRETKVQDIPTGADSCVTVPSVSTTGGWRSASGKSSSWGVCISTREKNALSQMDDTIYPHLSPMISTPPQHTAPDTSTLPSMSWHAPTRTTGQGYGRVNCFHPI